VARLPAFVREFSLCHTQDNEAAGEDDETRWRSHMMRQQWRLELAQVRASRGAWLDGSLSRDLPPPPTSSAAACESSLAASDGRL
jgi:hypothetical protein